MFQLDSSIVRTVGIASDTFFKTFGEDMESPDTIRGSLALAMMASAVKRGFKVVIVDGGSTDQFLRMAERTGAEVYRQNPADPGMSAARMQGYLYLFKDPAMKICVRIEPEKMPFITNGCADIAVQHLLENESILVIPARSPAAFTTLPPFQAESERLANAMYTDALLAAGLLPEEEDFRKVFGSGLDLFFGPRVFTREALPYFLRRYKSRPFRMQLDPESYSNALYFPFLQILKDRYLEYTTVEVPYTHPSEQTKLETGNPAFDAKRLKQRRMIVAELYEFLRLLYGEESAIYPDDIAA